MYFFEVAHGYMIFRCYASASEDQIRSVFATNPKNLDDIDLPDFDCIDEFDTDTLTVGWDIVDMWRG